MKIIEGKTGGQVNTDTHRIIKNRKELIVSDEKKQTEKSYSSDNIEELTKFAGISSAKIVTINQTYEIPNDPHIACLDLQKVTFPLIIRKWRVGDYFYPLGMKQKKKLSDYFIDEKYSKFDKENIFILESGGKIAWIIGDRIDDRFKITNSTKTGLLIKSKRKELVIKPIK
jgi:tRNA(Ile)-lysidine synthase